MCTMTTFRFWLPAQARAKLRQAVLFPTPSLGPVKTTTRPGSLSPMLFDDLHRDEQEEGLLLLDDAGRGEEQPDERDAPDEGDLGRGRALRAGLRADRH